MPYQNLVRTNQKGKFIYASFKLYLGNVQTFLELFILLEKTGNHFIEEQKSAHRPSLHMLMHISLRSTQLVLFGSGVAHNLKLVKNMLN